MGVYNNTVSRLDIIREVIMIMKNYVADELMNKVYHLTQALNKAKDIVSVLEEENKNLRDAFNNLASLNNEDYTVSSEGFSEQTYSV
jgi:MoxR-like ATPase